MPTSRRLYWIVSKSVTPISYVWQVYQVSWWCSLTFCHICTVFSSFKFGDSCIRCVASVQGELVVCSYLLSYNYVVSSVKVSDSYIRCVVSVQGEVAVIFCHIIMYVVSSFKVSDSYIRCVGSLPGELVVFSYLLSYL